MITDEKFQTKLLDWCLRLKDQDKKVSIVFVKKFALCKEKEAVKESKISLLGCVTDNLAVQESDSSFE